MASTRPDKGERKSSRPGGRPRNAWTRSRIRKACKLYTFTPLKMNEIVKVLEAPGFCPKKRNVETIIFNVLSKIPNRSKFTATQLLKGWREFRKCRELRRNRRQGESQRSRRITKSEFPSQLSDSSSAMALPIQTIPEITSTHEICNAGSNDEEAFGAACPRISLIRHEKDFRMKFLRNETPVTISQVMEVCDSSSSSGLSSAPSIVSSNPSKSQHRGSLLAADDPSVMDDPNTDTTDTTHSWKHFISDSFQDNCFTIDSQFPYDREINMRDFGVSLSSGETEVWQQLIDENVFEELHPILATSSRQPPFQSYNTPKLTFAPFNGNCEYCESIEASEVICHICGSSPLQRSYRGGNRSDSLGYTEINYRDYFDNGALHYAAEQEVVDFGLLIYLVLNGCDPRAKNTTGATFMHVLNWKYIWALKENQYGARIFEQFIDLTKILSSTLFDYNDCDYFGCTISHKAIFWLTSMDERYWDTSIIEKTFSILMPGFCFEDVLGISSDANISGLSASYYHLARQKSEVLRALKVKAQSNSRKRDLDCDSPDSLLVNGHRYPRNFERYIDVDGDTSIFRALKLRLKMPNDAFLMAKIEDLINLGAEIHRRNAKGDTALAVATRMGLPTVVDLLLSSGANPNFEVFGYRSVQTSLLSKAEFWMAQAKYHHDDRLHGGILSCISLLLRSGAVSEPCQLQQWGNKTIRAQITSGQLDTTGYP